ncbi:MAG: response regulator [Chloroflexota bacterium]|nr:response regulator [Chloroflexota bacterium]
MDKQYHILVVEDESDWREDIFYENLENAGYRVTASGSYDEAVAALERHVFDLAVIDVNLTGQRGNQDGIRVLEQMAYRGHRAKAIVVSGSKNRAMAAESVEKFRPIAFLDKPKFDVTEFLALIREALASDR